MHVDARAQSWAALALAGVGPRPLVQLLRAFGDPEAVLAATPAQRRAVVTAPAAAALDAGPDPDRLAATLAWLAGDGHGFLAWDDADYPPALLEIADPPPILFCLGRRELLARPALAIVGSRNATPQGCEDAEAFALALSAAGLTIVSGLAQGIDAAAHRGGLAGAARSIAVVGTGPDRVYPAANRDLAHVLAKDGLILSEFPPGTPARQHHFPRRNRLISGLARGVLVVEAALGSGSLITARMAAEQGREVFAIPGSIHSPFAKGCHRLIRDGAKLVETAQDVLEELKLVPPAAAASTAAGVPEASTVSTVPAAVLKALGYDPADVDTLSSRTGLDAPALLATLSALELDGRVAALPGGRWQRIGS
jgi:DNA processing protein